MSGELIPLAPGSAQKRALLVSLGMLWFIEGGLQSISAHREGNSINLGSTMRMKWQGTMEGVRLPDITNLLGGVMGGAAVLLEFIVHQELFNQQRTKAKEFWLDRSKFWPQVLGSAPSLLPRRPRFNSVLYGKCCM